jgi:hypothetical protein
MKSSYGGALASTSNIHNFSICAPENMKQLVGGALFNYLQVFADGYVKSPFDSC